MALRQFRLDDTLVEHGLEHWYATAVLGEMALIEIPRSGCVVELRRLRGARVLWHVQGGRSLTMPFAEAMQRLAAAGVGCRPFFWPMHEQPVFRRMGLFAGESFPVAERIARRGFYLPSGMALTEPQIDAVISAMHKLLA